jgi:hypothetical protein
MDAFSTVLGDRRGPADGIPTTDDPHEELDRLFELGYRRVRVRGEVWVWVDVPGGSKSWCAERPPEIRVCLHATAAPDALVRVGLVDRTDIVDRINRPGETQPAPVWLDSLTRDERLVVHIELKRHGRSEYIQHFLRATGRWWDQTTIAEDGARIRVEGAVLADR